jgi:hypothetical protein
MKTVQSLIDSGESKTLQVKFGSREVKPGDKVPKGGELTGEPSLLKNEQQ